MTNPTADAAKSKWLQFVCRAASRLIEVIELRAPDTVINGEVALIEKGLREAGIAVRPQPAPPAGEPDFRRVAKRLIPENFPGSIDPDISMYRRCMVAASIEHELKKAYRLGLAARPKVEDAEVAQICRYLRQVVKSPGAFKAADRLEHLSADLRTKETQLAQAYDVIAHTLTPANCFTGDIAVVTAAHARHQSRQQAAKDKP